MIARRPGRRTIRRTLPTLALALVGSMAIVTVLARSEGDANANGRGLDAPGAVDLSALDPVPVRTWGVSGQDPDATQTPSLDVLVWDIQEAGGRVFVAGGFLDVQERSSTTPIPQPYLAAFDVDTGVWIPTCRPSFDRIIYTLTVNSRGVLIVGGEFENVNGTSRRGLVGLDPTTCEIDESFTARVDRPWSSNRAMVREVEVAGDALYLAGNFSHVEGPVGNRMRAYKTARVDERWGEVDPTWKPQVNGSSVWGLSVDEARGRVHLAGYFSSVNGDDGYFNTVDTTTGATVAGQTPFPKNCCMSRQPESYDVGSTADLVAVSGEQHMVQFLDAGTREMRAFSHTGLECDGFEYCGTFSGGAYQVAEVIGNAILAGCHCTYEIRDGQISHYDSTTDERTPHKLVMAYDGTTGQLIEAFDPDVNARKDGVWAVASDSNGCLYIGGDLEAGGVASGEPRWLGGFAKLCPEGWEPGGGDVTAPPAPASVMATLSDDGAVVAWAPGEDPALGGPSDTDAYAVTRNGEHLAHVSARAPQPVEIPDLDPGQEGAWTGALLREPDAADHGAPAAGTGIAVLEGDARVRSTAALAVVDPGRHRFTVSVSEPGRAGPAHDAGRYVARILTGDDAGSLVELGRSVLDGDDLELAVWTDLVVEVDVDAGSAHVGRGLWVEVEHISVRDERTVGHVDRPRLATLVLDPAPTLLDPLVLGGIGVDEAVYGVIAIDAAGNVSPPVSAPPLLLGAPDDTPPTAPTGLVGAVEGTGISLSWEASTDEGTGVAGYEIVRDGIVIARVGPEVLAFTDPVPPVGRIVGYRIAAVDVAGNRSEPSTEARIGGPGADLSPPSIPIGLSAARDGGQVTLTWQSSTDVGDGMRSYLVYRNGAYVGWTRADTTRFVDDNLPAVGSLSYRLRATDLAGNVSSKSEELVVGAEQADTTAPSVPVGLVTVDGGGGTITLSWDPTTDDAAGVQSHLVYVDGAYVGWTPAGATSFTFQGLTPGEVVELSVRTVDRAGNRSAKSVPLAVTPAG